jgi:hypothetical protein
MTLDILLLSLPSIEELQQMALVFSSEVNDALINAQSSLPFNRQHQIKAIELTDGRWLLSADILSEIGATGLYEDGFMALSQEYFSQVEVIPLSEAIQLIPQINEI